MTEQHNLPQLAMYLQDLSCLPVLELPQGYTVRSFKPGDEAAWEQIIDDSFQMECDFIHHMYNDKQFKPERVWFVCHSGSPAATASAWFKEDRDADTGYLHMVGALSTHTGYGLGLSVSLAALGQMVREGRRHALLNTDDFRIPAIKTYLKLGFLPQLEHESHGPRWKQIASVIGYEFQGLDESGTIVKLT